MSVGDSKILIMGLAFVFTIVAELWFAKKTDFLSRSGKRKERAVAKGHIAWGTLRRSRRVWTQNGDNDYYLSAYTYLVDGKEYEITGVRSECQPWETIEVYYDDNPAKGFVRESASAGLRVPFFLIPFAVVFFLALLLK